MEGEFIIVALISTLGGLAGLMMINHNWFKRQEAKFSYDLKRARLNQKGKTIQKTKESSIGGDLISKALPAILEHLAPDQIEDLADRFLSGGDGETSGLGTILDNIPPELIQSFLSGLKNKTKTSEKLEEKFL
jgi:hypothetical protein